MTNPKMIKSVYVRHESEEGYQLFATNDERYPKCTVWVHKDDCPMEPPFECDCTDRQER